MTTAPPPRIVPTLTEVVAVAEEAQANAAPIAARAVPESAACPPDVADLPELTDVPDLSGPPWAETAFASSDELDLALPELAEPMATTAGTLNTDEASAADRSEPTEHDAETPTGWVDPLVASAALPGLPELPAAGPAWVFDPDALVTRVLTDLQRQADLMMEYRLRETMMPVLARLADTVVTELRVELSHTLRDVIARAVAQELARQRAGR